jgi:hypothetical protein
MRQAGMKRLILMLTVALFVASENASLRAFGDRQGAKRPIQDAYHTEVDIWGVERVVGPPQGVLIATGTSHMRALVSTCKDMQSKYGIVVGKSFGRMPLDLQLKWHRLKCKHYAH